MGFIGKILVVVHTAVSLAVLAWAFGIYSHSIDWNTPPPQPGAATTPGVFDKQQALAAQYNTAAEKAYARWMNNLVHVQALERERYPRRAFYQGQLQLVQNGTLPGREGRPVAVPNPVQELAYAPNGYLDISRPTGRKAFEVRPGVAGKALTQYDVDMKKVAEDIAASQAKNKMVIEAREKLNKEIVGQTEPTVIKGLRTLVSEQKGIYDRATNENTYVSDFVVNREAEFGLLKKRRDAMLDRKKELQPDGR